MNLEQMQREEARWRILRILDTGRPHHVVESLILRVLADVELPVTPEGLRRELDYLEDRKLVHIKDRDKPTWLVELTHHGVDIVEYTVPCMPGIARPPRD